MEQIIERMKVALGEIIKVKFAFDGEMSKVVETGRKQDEAAKYQEEQTVELEKRETAVKSIEDVVAFKRAAEEMAAQVDKGRIAFENAKNKFEAFMKSEKDNLATRKAEVSKNEALYKRELEALKVAREDVAQEAANIKERVLGNLAKQI